MPGELKMVSGAQPNVGGGESNTSFLATFSFSSQMGANAFKLLPSIPAGMLA